MQVTSLLSQKEDHRHDHDHDHKHDNCESCGHDHEHTQVRLTQVVVGLIFVINSYVVSALFSGGDMVSKFSAMIGAIILGYPSRWSLPTVASRSAMASVRS